LRRPSNAAASAVRCSRMPSNFASAGLRLFAFQRNAPARRFYEARGFIAKEFTDGATNMEREPDVLYEWTP